MKAGDDCEHNLAGKARDASKRWTTPARPQQCDGSRELPTTSTNAWQFPNPPPPLQDSFRCAAVHGASGGGTE